VPVDAYLLGPGIALVVVGLLALVLRWAYGGERPSPAALNADPDLGLLTEVATVPDTPTGRQLRALLSDAGIRSTLSTDRAGRLRVLVFEPDAERARRLLGPRT
jgi:hypothetical protein